MRTFSFFLTVFFLACIILVALPALQEKGYSLKHLTPENYHYKEAEQCSNCKGKENAFMPNASGVDLTSAIPALDKRGWLTSVHARSQSHEDGINTACAFCHAPLTEGATRDKDKAKSIPKGTWQGVSCFSCHPGAVERTKRKSLIINYIPGSDPASPDNYFFRNRADGKDMIAQCRFCHHESHDLLIDKKQRMMESGNLRCIDCHMAAYALTEGHVERYHNFKVEENIPHSCSGGLGRAMTCHDKTGKEWFKENLKKVKGPRKEWKADWIILKKI